MSHKYDAKERTERQLEADERQARIDQTSKPKEKQCKSNRLTNRCILVEGHYGIHRTDFGYTWHTHQRTINAARNRLDKGAK